MDFFAYAEAFAALVKLEFVSITGTSACDTLRVVSALSSYECDTS
jgi:hypothetical protein